MGGLDSAWSEVEQMWSRAQRITLRDFNPLSSMSALSDLEPGFVGRNSACLLQCPLLSAHLFGEAEGQRRSELGILQCTQPVKLEF